MSISPNTSWIKYHHPNPHIRLRLFCFPYAGGGASLFRHWAEKLPPEIGVYPVQLPGRENRLGETPFTHVTPLVQTLAQVLHPYLDLPFVFWGHSMGALISFELTRQLRRENKPLPQHLFVSGRSAPQIPDDDPPVHKLSEALFIEELRRLEGTPDAVLQHEELMQLFLPILRADFAIVETYPYEQAPPLACPISAFGGLADKKISRADLQAWEEQTTAAFKLRLFPGGHFYLHDKQEEILYAIAADLPEF